MGLHFFKDCDKEWELIEKGISRKIMGYDKSLMMVKVAFEKDAIGALHTHPHTQTSYVASGLFEVSINGDKKTLKTGDSFFASSDSEHGVKCLEPGVLIDIFSPVREDFL